MTAEIEVDANRVIASLHQQNAHLSMQVALLTARAEAAEEALREGTASGQ